MPIPNIIQPEYIFIDDTLRLRKFDGVFAFAYPWYEDLDAMYLMDGERAAYPKERVERMYRYLDAHGELYFIEILDKGRFTPIGDVTFWQKDMPIIIGDSRYRGRGIGKKVIAALVQRGRDLGYDALFVDDIFHNNLASRRCFEVNGFTAYEETEKGSRYRLSLHTGETI